MIPFYSIIQLNDDLHNKLSNGLIAYNEYHYSIIQLNDDFTQ